MSPRAKSASAIANDNKIRDASIEIANDIGLQHLRFGHIVEHTGLSTGALYSRFSDHNDLVASLWVERLREATFALLTEVVDAFDSNDPQRIGKLSERLHKLTKTEWAGIEALVIARRIPELDEVVSEDFVEQLQKFGLNTQSVNSDVRSTQVLTMLGLAFACAFNSFIDKGVDDWKDVLAIHHVVINDIKASNKKLTLPADPLPVVADTDDELRNTLINATAEVIARSGLDGATLSRIARRARMTSGAVYTLYSTKDELIEDALRVLVTAARSDTTSLVREAKNADDPFTSTMQVYAMAFEPVRRSFRQFRIEAFLSARTDQTVRNIMRNVYRQRMKEYDNLFGSDPRFPADFVRLVGRVGQMQPVGFTLVGQYINNPEQIDLAPLASSISRNVYHALAHAN